MITALKRFGLSQPALNIISSIYQDPSFYTRGKPIFDLEYADDTLLMALTTTTDTFCFLELNPRLQATQLQIAMGIPLYNVPDIRRFTMVNGREQLNRTALARLFFDLGRWLQENGVISLLQQPTQSGGDNLNTIAQNVTQSFPNVTGALAQFLGNLTEGFSIPAGGIPTILEQLGGLAFQDGGAATGAADQLAGLLNAAQALSQLGLDPTTALPILAGLGLSGANLGSIDFSSPLSVLSALTDSRNLELLLVAAGLLLEQASTANLQQFSGLVDRGAYWISHFVKPGSLTASLLGERTADGMRNDDDDFQTEAGGEAFNLLQWLQTTGVPALLGAQAATSPISNDMSSKNLAAL
ncbi:hypothetical protein AK812_SmicGene18699 [Symbiodinium microadriaticum]|uniref:Carbamoyl phosphate synthase ATP-binding domain-containing protein n=1 Tax=Symbiodinium microadriaticum TaxID=2951 RepID=A0A1Q9DUE6_SYMMI|nr:hypothetical protein AK812_SmicGene18699 [Symbiodinium microadriaticum]